MTVRAVFDCVVFLQGAARPAGPAGACFRLVEEGLVALCLSSEVLAEVQDVLHRPQIRSRFKTLTPARIAAFLGEVESRAVLVAEVPKLFAYPRDPDDEPYVNLAAAAGARYLVTRDQDLLALMDESSPDGKRFREMFPELTVLEPVTFLRDCAKEQASGEAAPDAPPSAPEEGHVENEPPAASQGPMS